MKRMSQLFQPFKRNEPYLTSTTLTLPIITITGTQSLLIENTYSLIEYEHNRIVLQSNEYTIAITGVNLSISFMYPNELMLTGSIEQVVFQ